MCHALHPSCLLSLAAAQVPYVDALTEMLDPDSHQLTHHEADEWGDPLADPRTLEMLSSLCPYHNLSDAHDYPPLLLTAGGWGRMLGSSPPLLLTAGGWAGAHAWQLPAPPTGGWRVGALAGAHLRPPASMPAPAFGVTSFTWGR